MAALRAAGAPLIMIITITTKIIIIIIIITIIIIIIIIMKMMMMIKMMTIISEPRKVDRLTSTKEYIKYQHEKQRFTNKLQKYKKNELSIALTNMIGPGPLDWPYLCSSSK